MSNILCRCARSWCNSSLFFSLTPLLLHARLPYGMTSRTYGEKTMRYSLVSSSWKFLSKQLFENTTIFRACLTKRRCLILYSEGVRFESRMDTEYSGIFHGCCQSAQANDWTVSLWVHIKIGYYHFFPSSFKFTERDRPFSPFETEQMMQLIYRR
jgi:hypothetical protein